MGSLGDASQTMTNLNFENGVIGEDIGQYFEESAWWTYWLWEPDYIGMYNCREYSSRFDNLPNIRAFYEVILVSLNEFVKPEF